MSNKGIQARLIRGIDSSFKGIQLVKAEINNIPEMKKMAPFRNNLNPPMLILLRLYTPIMAILGIMLKDKLFTNIYYLKKHYNARNSKIL